MGRNRASVTTSLQFIASRLLQTHDEITNYPCRQKSKIRGKIEKKALKVVIGFSYLTNVALGRKLVVVRYRRPISIFTKKLLAHKKCIPQLPSMSLHKHMYQSSSVNTCVERMNI